MRLSHPITQYSATLVRTVYSAVHYTGTRMVHLRTATNQEARFLPRTFSLPFLHNDNQTLSGPSGQQRKAQQRLLGFSPCEEPVCRSPFPSQRKCHTNLELNGQGSTCATHTKHAHESCYAGTPGPRVLRCCKVPYVYGGGGALPHSALEPFGVRFLLRQSPCFLRGLNRKSAPGVAWWVL